MSKQSSSSSNPTRNAAFINAINLDVLRSLALEVHAKTRSTSSEPLTASVVSCTVVTPPRQGGHNIAFDLEFSDGLSWLIRIPFEDWDAVDAGSMQRDIFAMEYITSRTSVPIPRLHAYCCTTDNPLAHPYMIMDRVRGVCLGSVWEDPSWWTGERRRENLFESLAGYMVELAGLEFDKIGTLDRLSDGSYVVAPFITRFGLLSVSNAPHEGFGPFRTTHEYLDALLAFRRSRESDPQELAWIALAQLFVGALPEAAFDSAPFTLAHPDFDSQNIFVDDTGRVVGIIDWDGVCTHPRALGAVTYPWFITCDWSPAMYDADEDESDSYRRMYADAVRIASGGKLDVVTRNSHVVSALYSAACGCFGSQGILIYLGQYLFGSDLVVMSMWEGLQQGGWLTGPPDAVARVKLWPEPDDDVSLKTGQAAREVQDAQKNEEARTSGLGWIRRLGGPMQRKALSAVKTCLPKRWSLSLRVVQVEHPSSSAIMTVL
ncbi:hypothetical protein OH77DRAFT_1035233 [Trametes cingulata]|nr:hypothetical protein OH77DRAFT_1035233 [Trametes cingulata]